MASGVEAAAAASSGSNGSPATAAPSSTRRAPSDSNPSSSASAAATEGGTSTSPSQSSRPGVPVRRRLGQRAGEVLEVERIAAALLVERGGLRSVDGRAEELTRLRAAERAKLDSDERIVRDARSRAPPTVAPAAGGDAWPEPSAPARAAGVATRPAVRWTPYPPNAGRRARARPGWPPQAVRAGRTPRGGSGSAHEMPAGDPTRARRATGTPGRAPFGRPRPGRQAHADRVPGRIPRARRRRPRTAGHAPAPMRDPLSTR